MKETINHPPHYGGGENLYEAIKVIENWELGFHLGNVLKYISRAGKKNSSSYKDLEESRLLEDLKKAQWYLNRKVKLLEKRIACEKCNQNPCICISYQTQDV